MMKEFILTHTAVNTVKQHYYRIKTLFPEVNIKFDSPSGDVSSSWVYVTGSTEELCEKTKKFITALTTPSSRGIMNISIEFQNLLLQNDRKILTDIERQNPAVIDLNTTTSQISIFGDDINITLARSLIEERINLFEKSKHSNTVDSNISSLVKSFGAITISDNVKAFALKLGYDNTDISTAVKNCTSNGLDVNEDTLLEELMKLKQPEELTNQISDIVQEEDKFVSSVARTVAESTSEQLTNGSSHMLRGIVIDGSNVAMCHGHKAIFSCIGIEIVINWFKKQGHTNIVAFVPQWRQEASKPDCPIKNQDILYTLEQEKHLVFTPSRRINGRRVVCYDDRYIVKYAVETDSVIVSNDNFRDLQKENPKWKQFLDDHLLMYSFVNDMFMPPDDPLGRSGPTLHEFLRKGSYATRTCPYRNKCTYGNKCRYYHPENTNNSTLPTVSTTNYNTNEYTDIMQRINSMNNSELIHSQNISQHTASTATNRQNYGQRLPMSCAAEMNMYEQQMPYQFHDHDVLAKGGEIRSQSGSLQGHSNGDPNVNIRDWTSQHPQVYPALNYYQSQYALPQQQQQQQQQRHHSQHHPQHQQHHLQHQQHHSQHQQHHSQQYYTQRSNHDYTNAQHWNGQQQSYTPNQPYTQTNGRSTNQQYIVQPVSSPNQQPQLSMVPGCMDPRAVGQQYFKPTFSHTLQTLETSKIPETRNLQDRMYLPERCPTMVDTNSVIFRQLSEFFPGRGNTIRKVLMENQNERDLNSLAQKVMQEQ